MESSKEESLDIAGILTRYDNQEPGSGSAYMSMVQLFESTVDISDKALAAYLRTIRRCVTMFSKEHEVLVGFLLEADCLTRDVAVVREYQAFVLNLLSAHTFYLSPCLELIFDYFSLHTRTKFKDKQRRRPLVYEGTVLRATLEQSFIYLHQLLQAVVQIVPMSRSLLAHIAAAYFPLVKSDGYVTESYVRNLLKISLYVTPVRCELLRLIVERTVEVDVLVPRDQVQEEDSDDEEPLKAGGTDDVDMFPLEDLQTAEEKVSAVPSMKHPEASKLDTLMDLLFTYVHGSCFSGNNLNWEAAKDLYKNLLSIFDSVLLPTHASSHVQFLIFYLCSFRTELVEAFLDYLWRKVVNPNVEPVYRQAAVSYLSSFLARARYISVYVVRAYLERMSDWTLRYIREAAYTSSHHTIDITRHGPFYAVCQAMFYVVVFRHRSIAAMTDGSAFCKSLNFPVIVGCRLNPLRVCHETVVDTFASVARISQMAFCDTILERNRRSTLPEAGSEGHFGRVGADQSFCMGSKFSLSLYFPFDPYMLSRSSRFIHDLYQEYEGPVGGSAREDSRGEEEEYLNCEEELSKANVVVGSLGSSVPTSAGEFFKFGRSPGFNRELS